ncbi:zinc finger CCCH type domain-containing protein [Geopyxis carbonaria]|nr:zinc finger CCCH type domain-containing protein [Geopyxis carbonaria]
MAERPSTNNRTKTPPNDGRRTGGLTASPRPKAKDSNNTLCRNITIYGYCRFDGKGCAFNHDPHSQKQNANGNSLGRGKFNVDSPSFTPSTPPKNVISPKAADAAPFTPKGHSAGTATPPVQPQFHTIATAAAPSYSLSQAVESQDTYNQSLQQSFDSLGMGENVFAPTRSPTRSRRRTNKMKTGASNLNPYEYSSGLATQVNPYAQTHDMFYQPTQSYSIPLNYHLYAPTAPYPQKLLPFQKNIHNFFLSDNVREELQRKGEATLQTLNLSAVLPASINEYHSLVPLDTTSQKSTQSFGYASWVYKAFSTEDGNTYALRRVEGFRLQNEADIRVIQRWKKVTSANIVTVHNAWTTTKFGDSTIVFVYDYHPLSKTLAEAHFGPNPIFAQSRPVPENVLWSYIVQLTSALKTIHGTGLSAKIIDLSKVLLTSKMRIRLNCCGMLDVIRPDTQRTLQESQQDDFISLGRMMLAIACSNPLAIHTYPKSIEYIGKQYSTHLRDTIFYLCSGQVKTVDKFAESIAGYMLQNFNSALHYEDTLESELTRELENGRLVRLLCKFGFINERPEYDHDIRWSETGDRYYLKLFRDYVFHSVDENNQPVVDIAHVLTCLNKLDAGVDEKVMLVSRDSLNCFVVSYKDLKRQVESTFQELTKPTRR